MFNKLIFMKKKPLRALVNLARGIFLTLSVMAMVVTVVWIFAPNLVDKVDTLIVDRYQSYHQAHFDKAKEILKDDKLKGIAALETFLNDNKNINVSDRLDQLKYQAFPLLIKNFKDLGRVREALYWANQWLDFHKKDLFAQVCHAELLLDIPGRKEEGEEALFQLFKMFPNVPKIVTAISKIDANLEVVRGFSEQTSRVRLSKLLQRKISLYWKGKGESFSEKQKSSVSIGGRIVSDHVDFDIMLPLGHSISAFRIDFPEIVGIEYTLDEVKLLSEKKEYLIMLGKVDIAYKHNLEILNNKFYVIGEDPHFVVNIENINSSICSINIKGYMK